MKDILIRLNSVEDVKEFVNIVSGFDGKAVLKSTQYIIDAKSIMGVFSVDLSEPLMLCLDNPSQEKIDRIREFTVI